MRLNFIAWSWRPFKIARWGIENSAEGVEHQRLRIGPLIVGWDRPLPPQVPDMFGEIDAALHGRPGGDK
jgi:hypothetical protein